MRRGGLVAEFALSAASLSCLTYRMLKCSAKGWHHTAQYPAPDAHLVGAFHASCTRIVKATTRHCRSAGFGAASLRGSCNAS